MTGSWGGVRSAAAILDGPADDGDGADGVLSQPTGIATAILFSPIAYKSKSCAEVPAPTNEQPTPSNIGNTPSLLLEGLTISKVTTAISRLICISYYCLQMGSF